jgi:hypothetical protein
MLHSYQATQVNQISTSDWQMAVRQDNVISIMLSQVYLFERS